MFKYWQSWGSNGEHGSWKAEILPTAAPTMPDQVTVIILQKNLGLV